MAKGKRKVDILLIDDNMGDVLLTQEAFHEIELNCTLHVVMDGEEAMEFLLKRGKHKEAVTPDIVLLDLNLPKIDGREILQQIKFDEALKHIPVIILTTSTSDEDIDFCYRKHANCFITKPVDFNQFVNAIRYIKRFWIDVVTLPSSPELRDI